MSITRYIATYVDGCRRGLRHRGALAVLAATAMTATACLGTIPDVTIGAESLNSLGQPDAVAIPSKGSEIPRQGDAQPADEQAAFSKEGPAEEASEPLNKTPEMADLSVFERLNPDGPKLLDPREYDQRLPLDAIRPIYEPLVGSPDEVQLDDDELVMGVSINGESRAYPISVLRFREMVNDELGGTPILVTW